MRRAPNNRFPRGRLLFPAIAAAGAILALLLAAALPVRLRALDPALLAAAGNGPADTHRLAARFLEEGRTGPVRLLWATVPPGGATNSPASAAAAEADRLHLLRLEAERPALRLSGAPAPFLEAVLDLAGITPGAAPDSGGSPPVLSLLLGADVRRAGVGYLAGSSRPAVPGLLAARHLGGMSRLVPADRPGGQAHEAVILFLALLAQADALDPDFLYASRLLRERAAAGEPEALRAWEECLLGALAVARRFDYGQAEVLLRRVRAPGDLAALGEALRRAPEQQAQIFTAVALGGAPGEVAALITSLADRGPEALAAANLAGEGAVARLLAAGQPVARVPALARPLRKLGEHLAPGLVLLPGPVAFSVKLALGLLSGFLGLLTLRSLLPGLTATGADHGRLPSVLLGTSLAAFAVVLAEPDVFAPGPVPAPPSPVFPLDLSGLATVLPRAVSTMSIDQTTILAVLFFLLVQFGVFLLGLAKLGQIRRLDAPPALKLKLLENEEHLFDLGLYIGLMGSAGSFIFLSLGVIEASVMAAYTSTLFGIIFVAFLKISKVRPFRRTLLEQAANSGESPPAP